MIALILLTLNIHAIQISYQNPFFYCFSKHYEGQIIDQGEYDYMIGLREDTEYGEEFLDKLRTKMRDHFCEEILNVERNTD